MYMENYSMLARQAWTGLLPIHAFCKYFKDQIMPMCRALLDDLDIYLNCALSSMTLNTR
jgi:hypothetical protein